MNKFPELSSFKKHTFRKYAPPSIFHLICKSNSVQEFKQHLQNISQKDREWVKDFTQQQSKCPFWFMYRQCCITGSIAKRIVSAAEKNKKLPGLDKAISKFDSDFYTNEAMLWGVNNESQGIDVLWNDFKNQHHQPGLHHAGICMDSDIQFLSGSPDIILSCINCCNPSGTFYAVGEIKCPWRLRNTGIDDWRNLDYLTENFELKKNHSYYFQLTLYCGILKMSRCYFTIWTPKGHKVLSVTFDEELYNIIKSSAEKYYYNHYLKDFFSD